MEQDLGKTLRFQQENARRSISPETLLSLLLSEKILKQDEVAEFQTVPIEGRIDYLFSKVQMKSNDTIKTFIDILSAKFPQTVGRASRKLDQYKLGDVPELSNVINLTEDRIRPVSLYATFGSRRAPIYRYSGHGSVSGKDSRPSSLRSKSPREREDIRFFFRPEEITSGADTGNQQKTMAQSSHQDNQKAPNGQNQHGFDRLRDQCMHAMKELEALRRKHQEVVNRCDLAVQEADYYRKQHKAVLNKCVQLVREAQALRAQYDNAITGKAKLQQDYEEIILLREREKMEKEGLLFGKGRRKSSETMLDDMRVNKDEMNDSREEALREKLDDIQADYAIVTSKLNQLDEESVKASEKYELLMQERDAIMMERDALKQQCTVAIREYEKALRDREDAIQASLKSEQELKAASKENEMNYRLRLNKETAKLQDERNAALQEYKLVMSERDSVHREIEKLQDDLSNSLKREATHLEEKEKIQREAECLRQEINTVLVDRDQAVKESYNIKERLEETLRDRDTVLKKVEDLQQDVEMKKQERDAARKERSEAISHRDKILKECFEVKQLFEAPAENIEKHSQLLKTRLDALSKELTKAWTVAEVAKLRRDWAFGERNKIVRESQKLSDLCNVLVSERDRIADELVTLQNKHEALRVQYSKTLKELLSIKKCRDLNLTEGLEICVSTDSAIDTGINECVLETLDLEKASKDGDFGFTIGGGVDAPLHPTDCSIFVTEVSPEGVAYGKLRVNDCILKVNEIDLTNVSTELASQAIQGSNFISLSVLRKRHCRPRTSVQSVKLIRTEDRELGLSIDSGLHIKRIEPGSIASEDETLSIGDKILTINGSQIENIPYRDARMMLKRSIVSLTILKGNASTASSHRSLAITPVDQEKELSETQSCDAEKSQSSPFVNPRQHRCPSVPVPMPNRMTEYPASLHSRRSSVMSGSSLSSHGRLSPDRFRRNTISETEKRTLREIRDLDEILRQNSERGSFSGKYSEGQLSDIEREDKMKGQGSQWQPSPPPQPARSNSYMTAIVSHWFTNNSASNDTSINSDTHSGTRSVRPQSAPGSRSFVYSMNNGSRRHELLLQNGASPIGFTNWPDSLPHGCSLPKSVGRQNRRTRTNITHGIPSATLPAANGRMHADSDRRIPDQFSSSGLKMGAVMGRNHHRSTSSHASSTSSMSSGFNASHTFIRPVYEEDTREGDPRIVVIQKGIYPLGISIGEGTKGGVFVTMVNENSAAGAAGLQFGDQLLEFNGINLRSANFNQAALILKQSADAATVTVLAQYNPHKLTETEDASANSQEESTQSTPKQKRKSNNLSVVSSHTKQNSLVSTATTIPNYEQPCNDDAALGDCDAEEARSVTMKKPTSTTLLGIVLSGGNATGIFVSDLEQDGFASAQGALRSGDRILEVNGVSFVNKTAEQAMLELAKPTETVQLIVQNDAAAFRKSKDLPGDSFYVRALFDRAAHNKEELNFKKGDILFVTNTLYQGKLGVWKAWLVTENEDQKKEGGTIPSKTKAEQEVLLRRCSVYSDDKMKIRHSFFRRSKKGSHGYSISHSRESSDSRGDEAGSSIGSNSAAFASDSELPAYQLVLRLDNPFLRPVIVIGPLSEPVCDKLVMEWPYKFARSLPEMVRTSKDVVEKDVESGMYLDYTLSRRGTSFACITQTGIKDVIDKNKHCLLDVNPSSLERLMSLNLHAIVMLLKFKSYKQIKELRDGHYIREKLTSKEAKDFFDQGTKLERDYKQHISAVISGNTLHSICSQVNDRLQEEQAKALWIDA